ncbi:MAG: hypothetical protein RL096_978, partial [Actinomycetota bacterium]
AAEAMAKIGLDRERMLKELKAR